jgi:predicted Zn-dependent peptidase
VLGTLSSIEAYGWPDDQVVREQQRIETMTLEQVREAATTLEVNELTWVIVGDLEQIEPQVRALELGEVTVLDADGRPL